jgi:hypothetical protein
MPQASQAGWVNTGRAALKPAGVAATAPTSIAAPSWSIPAMRLAPGAPATVVFAAVVFAAVVFAVVVFATVVFAVVVFATVVFAIRWPSTT